MPRLAYTLVVCFRIFRSRTLRVVILPDYDSLSRWAADLVVERISRFQPNSERPFVLGLPTGSTPRGLYRELAARCRAKTVSFRHVITFNMDEYVGLPAGHPESYRAFMQRHFFDHVDLPLEQANIPDGNAANLEQECRDYEAKIQAAGGIHLFIGGLGHDGHLAFNEPGSSLNSRTRVVSLTEDTIRANSRFFNHDLSQVPRHAVTVGIGTIMDAAEVLLLVSGAGKARALRHVVEGGVSQMWTASALQLHQQAIVVCDDDATLEMKVGTVRYFKQQEAGADTTGR